MSLKSIIIKFYYQVIFSRNNINSFFMLWNQNNKHLSKHIGIILIVSKNFTFLMENFDLWTKLIDFLFVNWFQQENII